MRAWPAVTGIAVGLTFCVFALILANTPPPAPQAFVPSEPRHPVTSKMLQDAKQREKKSAPDFELKDLAGRPYRLSDFHKSQPVVLVTTLTDCPCSMESQVVWNRLQKHYQGKVQFFGLVPDSLEEVKTYREGMEVPYPLLLASDKDLYAKYGVPNSVYVILISQDGKIYKMWPGYNQEMVKELDSLLAGLSGIKTLQVEPEILPKRLASGCDLFEKKLPAKTGS